MAGFLVNKMLNCWLSARAHARKLAHTHTEFFDNLTYSVPWSQLFLRVVPK